MALDDNCINLWEFDGDALDKIGSKDLTLTGGSYTTSNKNNIYDQSATLDGSDDNFTASDSGLPSGDSQRSIVILFYPISTTSKTILEYGTNDVGQKIQIVINYSSEGTFSIDFGSHRVSTVGGEVDINAWNLGIVSVPDSPTDTGDVTLYLNGAETTLSDSIGVPVTLNTTLGGTISLGSNVAETNWINTQVSQTAFYDVAVTAQQKSDLWNSGNFEKILSVGGNPMETTRMGRIIDPFMNSKKNVVI